MIIDPKAPQQEEFAVKISNVSKIFRLYHDPLFGPVKHALFGWLGKQRHYDEFMAVKHANLTLKSGEVVGVIGPNGAGKTTLLKMIAGLLPVDDGSISVNGKVTALLALGAGMHPELSGRENIRYSGILMGMGKSEIERKMEAIIDFSELADVIDQPLRIYSSGMRSRLMFSVSTAVEPDILIVDEALATGDAYFQQKAQRKIREICHGGATVLLVSHNLQEIKAQCTRCIVIRDGAIQFDGDVNNGIDMYVDTVHDDMDAKLTKKYASDHTERKVVGVGGIFLRDAQLLQNGKPTHTAVIGLETQFVLNVEADSNVEDATVMLHVESAKSDRTYAFVQLWDPTSEKWDGKQLSLSKGSHCITLDLGEFFVGDGSYDISVKFFSISPDFKFSEEACYASYRKFFSFQAIYRAKNVYGRGTMAEIPVRAFSVKQIPEDAN